ncbi:MAG: hypothetical protein ACI9X0_001586 [Kiritimatiellia bacterium]|jgi:hypothetical protein
MGENRLGLTVTILVLDFADVASRASAWSFSAGCADRTGNPPAGAGGYGVEMGENRLGLTVTD